MAQWYCQIDGKERGPYSTEQMRGLAASGQLTLNHRVRRLPQATWVPASRLNGLFFETPAAAEAASSAPRGGSPAGPLRGYAHIRRASLCLSGEERALRLSTAFVSVLLWFLGVLFAIATLGVGLLLYLVGWFFANRVLPEYQARRLQAIGAEATPGSFPEIVDALGECCEQFGVAEPPKVLILRGDAVNAFALRFARKRAIVLRSEVLDAVLERPSELRFLLGRELGRRLLDFGPRWFLEIGQSSRFRAARELSCDNCGTAAAGGDAPAVSVLKRLGVGHALHARLDDAELEAEARYLESGLVGWLLRQCRTEPPLGRRIANVKAFARAAEDWDP